MDIAKGIINTGNQNLLNLLLTNKKNIEIGFIGGSITRGTGATADLSYVNLFKKWLNKVNSSATIKNIGIGGTDSEYGVLRLTRDFEGKLPNIIVIEFSVNDKRKINEETYEALIQKILLAGSYPIILENFRFFSGENYAAVHTQIGQKYALPILSMKSLFNSGELNNLKLMKTLTEDGLHPNNKGHKLIFELLKYFFSKEVSLVEAVNWKLLPANKLNICDSVDITDLEDYKFRNGIEVSDEGKVFSWEGKTKIFGLQYKRSKGENPLCLEFSIMCEGQESIYELWLDRSDSKGNLLVISELWHSFVEKNLIVNCRAKLKENKKSEKLYITGIITSEV